MYHSSQGTNVIEMQLTQWFALEMYVNLNGIHQFDCHSGIQRSNGL